MLISLIVLPGTGLRPVQVAEGATLADLAEAEGLSGRQLVLNGQTVPRAQWADTTLSDHLVRGAVEVAALQGSKGN